MHHTKNSWGTFTFSPSHPFYSQSHPKQTFSAISRTGYFVLSKWNTVPFPNILYKGNHTVCTAFFFFAFLCLAFLLIYFEIICIANSSVLYSFLLLSTIPLYGYSIVCSPIHPLMNILDRSSFGSYK